MYLYYYVFIGASILSICSTESTNHGIPSQNYDKGNISLSYNFLYIHTTSKPQQDSSHNSNHKYQNKGWPQKLSQLENYQNIQYAPLPLRTEEQHSDEVLTPPRDGQKTDLYTEINILAYGNENNERTGSQEKKVQRSNLVPQVIPSEPSDDRPQKYVPGYNVDLQAVNNKLMQNGLYASNPNFLVKNKQVNINNLQPQMHSTKSNQANTKGYSVSTYQYFPDVKKYNENILPEDGHNKKQPFFYVKAPKVELNLARAQNIANAMHKASVVVNSSFKKLPLPPQEFFFNPQIVQPSKTKLCPEQNTNIYNMRHIE